MKQEDPTARLGIPVPRDTGGSQEELVAELAEVIGRASEAWCGRPNSARPPLHPATEEARAVLSWLAERGRLVPDGAQVAEEWGTRHHFQSGATTDTRFGSRDDASDVLLGRVAAGLPTSLIRRQVITGPWVAEEPT